MFLGNEWLFEFTKAADLGEINNPVWTVHPAILFCVTWFVIAAPALVATVVVSGGAHALRRMLPCVPAAGLFLFPAFVFTLTILSTLDHFTFTLWGFSSISHPVGPFYAANIAYALLFLAVWAWIARWCSKLKLKCLSARLPAAAILCLAFIAIAIAALVWWRFLQEQPKTVHSNMPNIFLLTIESPLADLSSAYSETGTDTTPFLRKIAKESLLVENYFSTAHSSRPALNTIITGLPTFVHKGMGRTAPVVESAVHQNLIHYLRSSGYDYLYTPEPGNRYRDFDSSFLFTPVPWLFRKVQSAEFVVSVLITNSKARVYKIFFNSDWPGPAMGLEDLAYTIAQAKRAGRPFFMHIHAMQSHGPYTRCPLRVLRQQPAGLAALPDIAPLERCYLAKLASSDAYAAQIFDSLQSLGHAEDTIFIVVGDHVPPPGYLRKAPPAMRAMMRSVLLVRFPHGYRSGQTIATNVQTIDIVPSILGYLQLPAPPWATGRSILADDFAAAERLRPIVIDAEEDRKVVVCDRFLTLPLHDWHTAKIPAPGTWLRVPGHTHPCEEAELPTAEVVQEFLRKFPQ